MKYLLVTNALAIWHIDEAQNLKTSKNTNTTLQNNYTPIKKKKNKDNQGDQP